MTVTVQCSNPQDIRLRVTVDLSLGEWREILKRLDAARAEVKESRLSYIPLEAMMDAVRRGIGAIESREDVKGLAEESMS